GSLPPRRRTGGAVVEVGGVSLVCRRHRPVSAACCLYEAREGAWRGRDDTERARAVETALERGGVPGRARTRLSWQRLASVSAHARGGRGYFPATRGALVR